MSCLLSYRRPHWPALANGFENLYIVGEGSGYSGGIISSGSDGIKAAMNIIERNSHCNIS